MTSWLSTSVIICTYRTYWIGFVASNIFIIHVKSTSIIMIFYVQISFLIIIHVSFHLNLLSIIMISHIQHDSIITIIDFHLVIFHNGAWIVFGQNTINDNSIPLARCRRDTPFRKHTIIVSSLLWITFVDKRGGGGGTVSCWCWSGPLRCAIGFLLLWTPVCIGIPCHCNFPYVIIL